MERAIGGSGQRDVEAADIGDVHAERPDRLQVLEARRGVVLHQHIEGGVDPEQGGSRGGVVVRIGVGHRGPSFRN